MIKTSTLLLLLGFLFLMNGFAKPGILASIKSTKYSGASKLPGKINVASDPSSGSFYVSYELGKTAKVNSKLYNMLGIVQANKSDLRMPGRYSDKFEMENLTPGIYFIEYVFVSEKGESKK